ncbi:12285_t:CDS:2, partial [Ambispora gerdemannii]
LGIERFLVEDPILVVERTISLRDSGRPHPKELSRQKTPGRARDLIVEQSCLVSFRELYVLKKAWSCIEKHEIVMESNEGSSDKIAEFKNEFANTVNTTIISTNATVNDTIIASATNTIANNTNNE